MKRTPLEQFEYETSGIPEYYNPIKDLYIVFYVNRNPLAQRIVCTIYNTNLDYKFWFTNDEPIESLEDILIESIRKYQFILDELKEMNENSKYHIYNSEIESTIEDKIVILVDLLGDVDFIVMKANKMKSEIVL